MLDKSKPTSSKEKLAALLRKKSTQTRLSSNYKFPILDSFHKLSAQSELPLSLTQKRFFLIEEIFAPELINHLPLALRITGPNNFSLLQDSFFKIVENNEILRTTFHAKNGSFFQKIHQRIEVPFEHSKQVSFNLNEEMEDFLKPFNLDKAPLFRIKYISTSDTEGFLLMDFHHIIADAHTFSILIENIILAFKTGFISKPPHQYRHYVQLEQQLIENSFCKEAQKFWVEKLNKSFLPVPFSEKKQNLNSSTSSGATYSFELDNEVKVKLKQIAASKQGTLYMLLISCFACLLHKKTSAKEFLIGTSLLGRSIKGTKDILGPFINNVPILCTFEGNETFTSFFKKIREHCIKVFEFESYPFLHFQEGDKKVQYNVFFELHHKKIEHFSVNNLEIELLDYHPAVSKFDLGLEVYDTEQGLLFDFEYATNLFDLDDIKEYAKEFTSLLNSVCKNIPPPLFHTDPQQNLTLLSKKLSPSLTPLLEKNIMQVIEENASKFPHKIATIEGEAQLTYKMLVNLVNRLAIQFESLGFQPESPLIILMDRSNEFLIAMLACFKTGIPYIPLDPAQPIQRLKTVLKEATAQGLIHDTTHEKTAHYLKDLVACYPIAPLLLDPTPGSLKYLTSSAQHIAYIIFTSGSTGKPKGVMVPHLGMMNHLAAKVQEFKITSSDCVAQTAIQTFDVSVWQFLVGLIAGASVSIFKGQTAWDPLELLHKIDSEHITIFETVPAHMKILLDYLEKVPHSLKFSNLKWLILNGEILTPDVCNRFFQLYPKIPIANAYGPTECSDDTCHKQIYKQVDPNAYSIPIGEVIPNTKAYILDKHLNEVLFGSQGELYFSGICLARGYYNKPALTAQAFIPASKGNRKYKTGDYARYLSGGDIEYISRVDNEVKIRGQRISPHEIDAILKTNSIIKDCIVVPFKNTLKDWALCCYFISNESSELVDTISNLKEFLRQRLPDAMVPRHFIEINTLPLLPNGKVNTKALPNPQKCQVEADEETDEEMSALENLISQIWKKALSLSSIKRTDHFFDIGGHSLLATQVVNLIGVQLKRSIPLKLLFTHPTIKDFSKEVQKIVDLPEDSSYSELPQIQQDLVNKYNPFPATEVQQAYLFGRKNIYELGNVSVHVYAEYEKDYIDIKKLEVSWNALIKRHDALRTIFPDPVTQIILKNNDWYTIKFIDFSHLEMAEQNQQLEEIRSQLSHEVFDSNKWPLFKIQVIKLVDKYRIYLSFDALLIDGWSTDILFNEWFKLYSKPETELNKIEISIRDYVLATVDLKNSPLFKKDKKFWQSKLPSFPFAPKLPIIKNPQEIKNPIFNRCTKKLPKKKWDFLRSHLKKHSFSPTGFLAALFGEVLAKFSGNYHFALNLTLFDRLPLHPQINDIAGDFTSLFLLEIDLRDQNASRLQRIKKTHQTLWDALEHKLYSGISFLRDLSQYHKSPVSFPIVLTAVLGIEDNQSQDIHNFFGTEVFSITQTPQVWLDYKAYEEEGNLVVEWDFVKDLFPSGFIKDIHDVYFKLLSELADSFENSEEMFSIELPLSQIESRKKYNLTTWENKPKTLYDTFCNSAQKFPSNPAVITSEKTLNYYELYTFSNQVGHHIKTLTTQTNSLIGVLIEKGWHQMVSVFGILSSGNAYLPIDPDLPSERILSIIKNAKLSVIIYEEKHLEKLKGIDSYKLLDIKTINFSKAPCERPASSITSPDSLAYTIFTSGSTGNPKGVMIEHKAVMNTLEDINDRLNLNSTDRTINLSKLSFDLSVYDIFAPLILGGAVVIPDPNELKNPSHWAYLIEKYKVTLWNTVPMYMQMLVEHLNLTELEIPNLNSLDKILLSGDWIPPHLPEKIFTHFPSSLLYSLGGATEASIWSIIYPIKHHDKYSRSIPYGKPLRNQTCYILDEFGQDQPNWVTGELYIGGFGLAKGYFNDSKKTESSFINHSKYGRVYKTGDLARHLPTEEIEIIGRKDSQIKIKGHRIELGDILACFKKHPDIENVLILPQKRGLEIDSLAAYFIPYVPKVDPEKGIIIDEQERFKFKLTQLKNQKPLSPITPSTNLAFDPDEKEQIFFKRKSYRNFSSRKLTSEELISWLSHPNYHFEKRDLNLTQKLEILSCIPSKDSLFPKYYYPSAGNIYPVTVFVRILDNYSGILESGLYQYDPYSHTLSIASCNIEFNPQSDTGYSLLFVSQTNKIEPLYGSSSKAFIYLEYGYMIGALETIYLFDSSSLELDLNIIKKEALPSNYSYPLVIQTKNIDSTQEKARKINILIYIKENFFTNLEAGWYEWTDSELKKIKKDSLFSLSLASDLNYFINYNAAAICFFLSDHPPCEEDYIEVGRLSQKICSYPKNSPLIGSCAIGMLDPRGENILKKCFPNQNFIQAVAFGPIEEEDLLKKQESKVTKEAFYSVIDQYLRNHLPNYMIPSQYLALEKFPLSQNGKLDTKSLPDLTHESSKVQKDLPKTQIEKQLASIWKESIQLKESLIGVHDNFFEIGGNSLIAIQVHHQLVKEFSSSIQIDDLFRYPTISKLSKLLENVQTSTFNSLNLTSQVQKQKQRIRQSKKRHKKNS